MRALPELPGVVSVQGFLRELLVWDLAVAVVAGRLVAAAQDASLD